MKLNKQDFNQLNIKKKTLPVLWLKLLPFSKTLSLECDNIFHKTILFKKFLH